MVVDDVWITMRDGVRLFGRVWRAQSGTSPVIVECHPYRITDMSVGRDAATGKALAVDGYAYLRVDLRGSGNSEGLLLDEYLPQEQDDGEDVIAWAAAQPWSTGAVGWVGISWGGFAGLQVAARRPPALKAVITICSTDDRYADDVHYRGGAVLASDMLPWATTMLLFNSLPPDPRYVGERWRQMWLDRIKGQQLLAETWMRHPTRDDYWKHGSICEDYSAVEVPVFVVGGWADGYVDAALRMHRELVAPHKTLIGPWAHGSPESTGPGPNLDFHQECVRWWDRWLKGADNGVESLAPLRVWLQDYVPPATYYADRPGRWVEPETPAEAVFFLSEDRRLAGEPSGREATIRWNRPPLPAPAHPGAWCPSGQEGDWPGDQNAEDALAVSFTSEPLSTELALLGNPVVALSLRTPAEHGHVAVRLCDIAPDGSSLLVSRGVQALRGATQGVVVELPLKGASHRFMPGHRIRVAISGDYWPWLAPNPDGSWLDITSSRDCSVRLPVPALVASGDARPVPAVSAAPTRAAAAGGWQREMRITEQGHRTTIAVDTEQEGSYRLEDGLHLASSSRNVFTLGPTSIVETFRHASRTRGPDFDCAVSVSSRLELANGIWLLSAHVDARERDVTVATRDWAVEIPAWPVVAES